MFLRMRTTLDLNDELLRAAKRQAADRGVSLKQVVEDALHSQLKDLPRQTGYRLQWRTERGKLQPGVRLDDRDALFDLMDGRN